MSKARIVLPIEGMTCASCAATVQEALTGAGGVTSAGVNFATNKAAIEYDDAQTNVGQLIKTVREAGYNCGTASVTFAITGLHYASSVAPPERGRAAAGLGRSSWLGARPHVDHVGAGDHHASGRHLVGATVL